MSRSRKRPTRSTPTDSLTEQTPPDDNLEELEELEELDELEELEEWEPTDGDDRVKINHDATGGDGFDVKLTIKIDDMEKAAVAEALDAPLRSAMAALGDALRWQTVLVSFEGETLISSAAKAQVAETMAAASPRQVIVQRGFGDELVLENDLPSIDCTVDSDPENPTSLRAVMETGDLDVTDQAVAMASAMNAGLADVSGKAIDAHFRGATDPDEAIIESLVGHLDRGGATRLVVNTSTGARLLFDRTLESMVTIDEAADETRVTIRLGDDQETTCDAMALVLPPAHHRLNGKRVVVSCEGGRARPDELAALLCHAAGTTPARLELDHGGARELLWPLLISTPGDDAGLVEIRPAGRDRKGVLDSLAREAAGLSRTSGLAVTIDLPADHSLDTELEAALLAALAPHSPATIACSFGGDNREPLAPAALEISPGPDGQLTIAIQTDAGKPAELVRAIERRMPTLSDKLSGADVTLQVTGDGAVSRSMRRTLLQQLELAGVGFARLLDQGETVVLLPHLLSHASDDGGSRAVTVNEGGRSPEQLAQDLDSELTSLIDDQALAGVTVTIHWPEVTAEDDRLTAMTDRLTQSEPAAIMLARPAGEPTQLYPEELEELPELDELPEQPQEEPSSMEAAASAHIVGRREHASPPMIMIALDPGASTDATQASLDALSNDLNGKQVLVLYRSQHGEQSPDASAPSVALARDTIGGVAAAVLEFHRGSAGTPDHFQVTYSSLPGLTVDDRLRDPRPSRATASIPAAPTPVYPSWLITVTPGS